MITKIGTQVAQIVKVTAGVLLFREYVGGLTVVRCHSFQIVTSSPQISPFLPPLLPTPVHGSQHAPNLQHQRRRSSNRPHVSQTP